MEGYLGQVIGQGHEVKSISMGLTIEWLSEFFDAFIDVDAKEETEETV